MTVWSQAWPGTTLIPAVRRQKKVDLCELETSLVYRVSGQPWLHREILSGKTRPEPKQTSTNIRRIRLS